MIKNDHFQIFIISQIHSYLSGILKYNTIVYLLANMNYWCSKDRISIIIEI